MGSVSVEHGGSELIAEFGQPDVLVSALVEVFLVDVQVQTGSYVADLQ